MPFLIDYALVTTNGVKSVQQNTTGEVKDLLWVYLDTYIPEYTANETYTVSDPEQFKRMSEINEVQCTNSGLPFEKDTVFGTAVRDIGYITIRTRRVEEELTLTREHVDLMQHAVKNDNKFSTRTDNPLWSALEAQGFAKHRGGWEEGYTYYSLTPAGQDALHVNESQKELLRNAFGLSYSKRPYRNYCDARREIPEWEDLCLKGYATKRDDDGVVYHGTVEGLRLVYRKDVTEKYFQKI